jgi:hypothetical protein
MFNKINEREDSRMQPARRKNYSLPVFMAAIALLAFQVSLKAQETNQTNTPAAGSENKTVTVPTGTRFMVRMNDAVDSDKNQVNDRFRGTLEANLMAGDVVVAPKGTTVFGRLLTADSSSRQAGGQLELDLTDITINGQMYSLVTSSNQMQGEAPSGSSSTGTGAKAGAAVGALAGGISGAIRGGGAGAVAGKVSGATTSGETVKVPAGTMLDFTLDHPVSLPVAQQ